MTDATNAPDTEPVEARVSGTFTVRFLDIKTWLKPGLDLDSDADRTFIAEQIEGYSMEDVLGLGRSEMEIDDLRYEGA